MSMPSDLPANDDDVLAQALAWIQSGYGVALATVLATWGSSPRPAGSQMAVRRDGAFVGSVSGGCIEGAVITTAQECLHDGRPRVLEFGIADESAWAVGLACGGRVRVLVAPMPQGMDRLAAARRANLPASLTIDLKGGYLPDAPVAAPLAEAVADLVARGQDGLVEAAGQAVRVYGPRWRLVVVGAVHIAQVLMPMAAACGLETVLVDPRTGFADPRRFPGQRIVADWPEDVLPGLRLDRATAVVVLCHDPKLDDPALLGALASDAFYVGALGSRRTNEKRRERLLAQGLAPERLAHLHAPIGLDIGARSPAEIAVSILAEIIAARHRP